MAPVGGLEAAEPLGDVSQAKRNQRLRNAVHRHKAASRQGLQERLFTLAFSGLVYPQIWEDPIVDLEALAPKDGEHFVAIASGGCNVLSYVTAANIEMTAIDLNPAHIALNKMKLAAARYLPNYNAFHRFFAEADTAENVNAYFTYLQPHLDDATRNYWEKRDRLGRRRIGYFGRNFYKHGLLGNFIAAGHFVARLHGRNPRKMLTAKTRDEQIRIFEEELAPLFEKRHLKWLMNKPAALFGLGIPPSQFKELKGNEAHMSTVLLERLRKLSCDFDLSDNYFAWQAFGRRYATGGAGPLPPYLQAENYEALRARAENVDIVHASFTEYLASQPEASCDGCVLLDAQDWMTDQQLSDLWTEIVRTARPGARVIFRTAGVETILPGRLPDEILARFDYDPERSKAMGEKDRSSIYGGFHLYVFRG